MDADKKTRSFVIKLDVNFADDDWQSIYTWMVDKMLTMREVMQKFGE